MSRLDRRGIFGRAKMRREARGPATARWVVGVVCAFLLVAGSFAAVTPFEAVVRAPGEIVPAGHPRDIQHDTGGTVVAVMADEGDRVARGQILARLDAPDLRRDLMDAATALESLRLRRATLAALAVPGGGEAASPEGVSSLSGDAAAYAEARLASHAARVSAGETALDAIDVRIASLAAARRAAAQRVAHVEDRLARLTALSERGVIPDLRLAEERGQMAEIAGDLARTEADLAEARARRAERAAANADLVHAFREETVSALFDLRQEERQLHATHDALAAALAGLTLRAPEDGIVQAVMHPAKGEVVAPGATMFTIVPASADLVAELRIAPDDIAHVRVGDPVEVKLGSFDYRRYGGVAGTIAALSPGQVVAEDGTRHFRATVALSRPVVGRGAETHAITPGMQAVAEVPVASRTLMTYLLKPIRTGFETAFSER